MSKITAEYCAKQKQNCTLQITVLTVLTQLILSITQYLSPPKDPHKDLCKNSNEKNDWMNLLLCNKVIRLACIPHISHIFSNARNLAPHEKLLVTKLHIMDKSKHPMFLDKNVFALFQNVRELSFCRFSNAVLTPALLLPEKLTVLKLGTSHKLTDLNLHLSLRLTRLQLGDLFDEPIVVGTLPERLLELIFGNTFNQKISSGVLPEGLTKLHLGFKFNQLLLPGVLPIGLTTLVFNGYFDQILSDGVLPPNLLNLEFGNGFNKILLPGTLP